MTHLVDIAANLPLSASNGADYPPCRSIRAPRWACVYTHPAAERWANDNLTRSGYQTYLPLYLVSRPDRATPTIIHHVLVPLWSRYLFVQFDHLAASWSPIRDTPGVSDLVRSGSDVHYVSQATVSALQAGEALRRNPPTGQPHGWPPGTPCALGNAMPMGGLPAVVLDSTRSKVKIGIMFLGDVRIVSVPPECLVRRDVSG